MKQLQGQVKLATPHPAENIIMSLDLNYDERLELTKRIMHLIDNWGLNAKQLVDLLSLPKGTPTRALRRYRENTPFPEDAAVSERLEHICGIVDALRTTYPHNPSMGMLWMRQPNKRFGATPPAQWIAVHGLKGLVEVRTHLDCSYDWFNDNRYSSKS